MAKCAVVDLQTNKQLNFIVAEETDIAPDGCKLVEIPDGHYWNEELGQAQLRALPQDNEDLPKANIVQKITQSIMNFFGITPKGD
jgi:hypothetical protein